MTITAEGCGIIATVIPVLLLAGLASERFIEWTRRFHKLDRAVFYLWVVQAVFATAGAIGGVSSGDGLDGANALIVYGLLGVSMLGFLGVVAIAMFSEAPNARQDAHHHEGSEGPDGE